MEYEKQLIGDYYVVRGYYKGKLEFFQEFSPIGNGERMTESEADSLIKQLSESEVIYKPTYEMLEKELESTQNELLIAKGVI